VLLRRPEQFVASFTEKLFTYALGREVEFYDAPAIRKIVREAAPDNSWLSIILGIVRSTPFQFRRSARLQWPRLRIANCDRTGESVASVWE
jgi:hypothetical protein